MTGQVNVLTGSRKWVTGVNRILCYQSSRRDSLDKIKSFDCLQKVGDLGDLVEQDISVLKQEERARICRAATNSKIFYHLSSSYEN